MFQDLPMVTRVLLIANVGMYLLQLLLGDLLIVYFALWPWGDDGIVGFDGGVPIIAGFQPWQLLTYGFLHGGLTHLFFNMLALFMFGGSIERLFGARPYIVYYLTAVVGAAITQLLVLEFSGDQGFYPTLGASGGVFGLLLAFGLMYPHRQILLLFPPIPMPAWLFVILYGGLELYLGVTGTQAGVAHFAHLGGMAFGYLLIQYWRGRLPIKPARRLMR